MHRGICDRLPCPAPGLCPGPSPSIRRGQQTANGSGVPSPLPPHTAPDPFHTDTPTLLHARPKRGPPVADASPLGPVHAPPPSDPDGAAYSPLQSGDLSPGRGRGDYRYAGARDGAVAPRLRSSSHNPSSSRRASAVIKAARPPHMPLEALLQARPRPATGLPLQPPAPPLGPAQDLPSPAGPLHDPLGHAPHPHVGTPDRPPWAGGMPHAPPADPSHLGSAPEHLHMGYVSRLPPAEPPALLPPPGLPLDTPADPLRPPDVAASAGGAVARYLELPGGLPPAFPGEPAVPALESAGPMPLPAPDAPLERFHIVIAEPGQRVVRRGPPAPAPALGPGPVEHATPMSGHAPARGPPVGYPQAVPGGGHREAPPPHISPRAGKGMPGPGPYPQRPARGPSYEYPHVPVEAHPEYPPGHMGPAPDLQRGPMGLPQGPPSELPHARPVEHMRRNPDSPEYPRLLPPGYSPGYPSAASSTLGPERPRAAEEMLPGRSPMDHHPLARYRSPTSQDRPSPGGSPQEGAQMPAEDPSQVPAFRGGTCPGPGRGTGAGGGPGIRKGRAAEQPLYNAGLAAPDGVSGFELLVTPCPPGLLFTTRHHWGWGGCPPPPPHHPQDPPFKILGPIFLSASSAQLVTVLAGFVPMFVRCFCLLYCLSM